MNKQIGSYNQNVMMNFVFKIATIFLGVFSVNVNLGYLGSTLYGLWVTIASVVSWMQSGDFGIGNGLRNELAKAYSLDDLELQKKLVSTAIRSLSRLAIILFGVLLLVVETMISVGIMEEMVRIPFYVTSVFFCLNLVVGISQSVAYALRKSWYVACVNCASVFLSICLVSFINGLTDNPNLILFAFIHGICSLLPNLFLLFVLKHNKIDFGTVKIMPNESKIIYSKILGVGIQFFVIQICCVILYSTDNVIINYLFGSEQVTKYSIISKVYDTGNNLFSILLVELWSAVTFHIARNNYRWVSDKIRLLLKLWLLYVCGVVVVSLIFNLIIKVWLGREAIFFESPLVFVFGLYSILTSYSAIFTAVVNGTGKIKLQLVLAIVEAVINVPLSVFFAQYCGMGIMGVKLATMVCVAFGAVAMPLQVIGMLNKKLSEGDL